MGGLCYNLASRRDLIGRHVEITQDGHRFRGPIKHISTTADNRVLFECEWVVVQENCRGEWSIPGDDSRIFYLPVKAQYGEAADTGKIVFSANLLGTVIIWPEGNHLDLTTVEELTPTPVTSLVS